VRPILPVRAGMADCGDQTAVPGDGLRQDAVIEFAAADTVTEQDQRLDLVEGLAADGGVEREGSHGDGSRRGYRRAIQSDRRRGRIRCCTSRLDLHPPAS